MIPYWHSSPTSTPLGLRNAIRKSRKVSEAPMPSMISAIIKPSRRVSVSVSMAGPRGVRCQVGGVRAANSAFTSAFKSLRRILPMGVLGNSSRNTTDFGTL